MNSNDFPDALPPEYRLHWYVLEGVLGQGGFGITYVGRDTNLATTVAIKEYLPVEVATRRPDASVRSRTEDQAERYSGGLERFIREARTLARFDHPNIVRVHSVFELNGTAYMVMRFEEGETLAALLERRHSLPEPELKRILLPVLDGLELVHGAGFIHRDIKPDNILIRVDGSPVLLDFGSARYALGQSRTVTILVAPGYAPIEQYYDSGESQGPWTDIYGLGATCYRAITGHAPMDAIARSKGKLGSTQEMLLPAAVAGAGRYSERFLAAVDRALEFSEKDRPQSVAQWRALLAEDPRPAFVSPPSAPAADSASGQAVPPRARRGGSMWAAAGAGAAIAAIAVVTMWNRVDLPATKPPPPQPVELAATRADGQVEELRKQLAELQSVQRETQDRLSSMLQKPAGPEPRRVETEPPRQLAQPQKRAAEQRPPPAKPAVTAAPVEIAAKSEPLEKVAAAPPSAPVTAALPPATPVVPRETAPAPNDPRAQLKFLAEGNDTVAMLKLGDLYLAGEGVERSDQEAARLYRRAADAGNSDAQLRLGDLYSQGRGVPQNNFQAYVWYSAAARSGNGAAKSRQERTAKTLQSAEIRQAGKLVDAMLRKER